MSEEATDYNASHIQVLQGYEAVRKRPGMYIGSTGERGLRHLVFEIADRAVNEVLAGRASRVEVTLMPDGGVCVSDDGHGEPAEDGDGSGLEALLTHMAFGPRGGDRHDVTLGFAGVGPFVVNALSSRLTAEVLRDGARWVQEYARGVVVTPPTRTEPATGSGTTIDFWPDAEIFETTEVSFDALAERFREVAFLNGGLEIVLTDQRRPAESQSLRFWFPGGVRDFVAFLDGQVGVPAASPGDPDTIAFEQEDATMAGIVEVALRWRGDGERRVRSFANSRATPGGGTHELGFQDGLTAAINTYAREQRLLAETAPDLSAAQIGQGLTAVVSVKLDHPELEGCTHDALGNAPVRGYVAQAVREHLGRWLAEHPEQATAFIRRIVLDAQRD